MSNCRVFNQSQVSIHDWRDELSYKNTKSGFELMSIHVTYVEINAWYVILNGDRYDVCELGFCSTFIRIIPKKGVL